MCSYLCFFFQITWQRFQNTLSYDGQTVDNVATLAACQQNCIDTTNCMALDWDGVCFLHIGNAYLNSVVTDVNGVDQYRKVE